MPKELKADDILPLIAKLSIGERQRLLRLVLKQGSSDAQVYTTKPPLDDEFSSEDDPLSWDNDAWENLECSK